MKSAEHNITNKNIEVQNLSKINLFTITTWFSFTKINFETSKFEFGFELRGIKVWIKPSRQLHVQS